MHGRATPPLKRALNPVHQRIARLSMEFIDATPERREQIGAEISAMLDGKLDVIGTFGR